MATTKIKVSGPWKDGKEIPKYYTLYGDNVQPALKWDKVKGARSYLIILVDRAPIAKNWIHMVAVSRGTSLRGARFYPNTWGHPKYEGPKPPTGGPHKYEFLVYAFDHDLKYSGKKTWSQIKAFVKENSPIAQGVYTGVYSYAKE